MFTNAEIIFYDENDNSSSLTLTAPQIYAIKKILGLNYDYKEQCFLCYDDESVLNLTEALFKKWRLSKFEE
ncbi:MAG: hypothetical protein MJH09_11035 [Cetobacterium sp.]|nr:hypothetical protein [Cetobacterium sp.]